MIALWCESSVITTINFIIVAKKVANCLLVAQGLMAEGGDSHCPLHLLEVLGCLRLWQAREKKEELAI